MIANNAMASNKVDPSHAPAILGEILEEWPARYAEGQRLGGLVALVNRVVRQYALVAIVVIILCLVTPGLAVPNRGPRSVELDEQTGETLEAQPRFKREGFGPWEANDAWDEKGKSNIAPVLKRLADVIAEEAVAVEKVLNASMVIAGEVVEVFEHPFRELSKTYIGWAILIVAGICVAGVLLRILVPFLRVLWRVLMLSYKYLCVPIYRLCAGSACCMYFCALRPFVIMRNAIHRKRMEEETRRRMEIYKPSEEIQMLRRTTSAVYTDEAGVYLLADENHRVYLQPERRTEDFLMLKSLSDANRDKGVTVETVKESVLSTSKLYKIDKIPDFQGTFEVDGNLIGHFSRIKFNGIDCLLTAYHVLDYNRTALINLRKGDKCVKLSSVTANVVAASRTEHLDYLILSIPSCVFSTLGMKVGVWTSRVQPREPVQINQFYEGKPCVSSAAVKLSATKSWHVNYAASTTVGTSGAPILDSKNHIVGVHLEYDAVAKLNVGVIPPVFRMNKKESPTNEDIAQGQPELIAYDEWYDLYETPDSDDDENMDDLYEIEAYETFLTKERDTLGIYESGASWGSFMEDRDDSVAEEMHRKYGERYHVYRTATGKTGNNIGARIKGGRYRKESPWTCSQCACVQNKGYQCINCGYALIPLDKKKIEKVEEGASVAKTYLENKLPTEMVTKIMDQVTEDTFIKKIALQVAQMLESTGVVAKRDPQADLPTVLETLKGHKRGWEVKEDLQQGLYPDLPTYKEIPVEKKLVQKLKTVRDSAAMKVESDNSLNIATHALLPGQDLFADGLTKVKTHVAKVSPKKGVAPARVNPRKETVVVQEGQQPQMAVVVQQAESKPVLSKSAKRRLRIQKKKETLEAPEQKEASESAVPLNSKAPAKSGAPTTSGLNKPSHSRSNPKRSEGATSSSQGQARGRKPRNGKPPAAKTQATQNTPGPQGEQRQKSAASNCSATNTL
jgi:hypothetical protein